MRLRRVGGLAVVVACLVAGGCAGASNGPGRSGGPSASSSVSITPSATSAPAHWSVQIGNMALNQVILDDKSRHRLYTMQVEGTLVERFVDEDGTTERHLDYDMETFSVDTAYVAGKGVVYRKVDLNDDPGEVYWWPRGAKASLLWSGSMDRSGELAVIDDTAYLIEEIDETHSCIMSYDLSAPDPKSTAKRWQCSPPGEWWWWLRTDGTTLSWLRLTDEHIQSDGCADIFRWPGTGQPEQVTRGQCVLRGQASATIAVWAGKPPVTPIGENWDAVPLYAYHHGTITNVGTGQSGSAVVCDGVVFWKGSEEAGETHRWKPGHTSQRIYSDPETTLITGPQCVSPNKVGVQAWQGDVGPGTQTYLTTSTAW